MLPSRVAVRSRIVEATRIRDRALATAKDSEMTMRSGLTKGVMLSALRDLSGRVVTDQMVKHIYLVEDGLIRHMESGS